MLPYHSCLSFFFYDPATTEIYTLSLHDLFRSNTNLSKQQQVSEIMRQMLTQAQTAGQYFAHNLGNLLLDRKSGSAGMPRPISYAVFCLRTKTRHPRHRPPDQPQASSRIQDTTT